MGKDVYRKLGTKIDSLHVRAPWNEAFHEILKELYSPEEADFFVRMPYNFSSLDRVVALTKTGKVKALKLLDGLCAKGLVVDFWIEDEYKYMPSPMVVGIFEFTMMRTGKNLNSGEWGNLFHAYLLGDEGAFYAANFANGEQVSITRALPHEETLADHVEILDYERAAALLDGFDKFAIGLCSCRHEKLHAGEKECDIPLNTCTSFGKAADYLVRHDMAKEVSREEMRESFARSREMGLVIEADNVRKEVMFICHCCGCCCNVLQGINRFGFANAMVTSSFIAEVDDAVCNGCGKCAVACPINAIEMLPVVPVPGSKKKKNPEVDHSLCLGCGVCGLKCSTGALKLQAREKRVIHPETTFERVLLQSLERGTLQNQILDNMQSMTQQVMRPLLGAFLGLPSVKKALMSDLLRSTFLHAMRSGVKLQGKGWITDL